MTAVVYFAFVLLVFCAAGALSEKYLLHDDPTPNQEKDQSE